MWGVTPRLLLILILFETLFALPPPDVSETSPPVVNDDAATTAYCPTGHSMIDCRLSSDSSYENSDGLKFDENACTAYGRGNGNYVKVTEFV